MCGGGGEEGGSAGFIPLHSISFPFLCKLTQQRASSVEVYSILLLFVQIDTATGIISGGIFHFVAFCADRYSKGHHHWRRFFVCFVFIVANIDLFHSCTDMY